VTVGELPYWFVAGLAIVLGLLWGSFLNVVIHRLPREESLVRPGSRCPGCGRPIRAWHNVPVLSWLLLRGRASCCGARISPRYPLVELIGGLVAWAVVETRIVTLPSETEAWRALALFALYLALALGLIAAAFIDLEHMILPDSITLGGALLGLASVPLRPADVGWLDALIGAAVGFVVIWLPFVLLYQLLRGHPGMGLGDAKLTLLAGAWFGWPGAVFALLAGAVQGTVMAFVVFAVRGKIEEPEAVRKEREEMLAEIEAAEGEERAALEAELAKDPIGREPEEGLGKARLPFGPFLALATLEYLLFGKVLWLEYLAWLTNV
jgi:leader peptidase (prepilin peptidase)/N-methyltransferase